MVRVIIVEPVGENQIGTEAADEANQRVSSFQRRHEGAVRVVQQLVGSANDGAGGAGFGTTPLREGGAVLEMVAGAAVGDADKLHFAAEPAPFAGRAAGLEIGVVGMQRLRPESEVLP